jgi:RNA polymerase sigma-70 factor (ECF subfamily)
MSSKASPSKNKANSTGQPPRKEIDSALVKAHLAGEPSAFKALSDRYRDPLMFHVRKIARDEGSLEDLIQEIFTKAFENLDKYNHEYAFSTWLYRIATNHTIDSLRKRKMVTLSIDAPIQANDGDVTRELPSSAPSPHDQLQKKERAAHIHQAMESLPEKYREVLRLRHFEEMSYQEISEELQQPIGTVKAQLFRARESLMKALKDTMSQY